MKNHRIMANLLSLAFTFGACAASQAMSTLFGLTLQPQWPESAQPGTVVLYNITVTRTGQGNLEVDLSTLGLPEGVSATFSQNPVRFTGRSPSTLSTTLILTCPQVMPTDDYPFVITGAAERESSTVTNQVPQSAALTAAAQPSSPPVLALDQLGATSMKVRGKGASGQTYQVQASPGLVHPAWGTTGSSTADGNGRFSFVDSTTGSAPMRFYRALLPATGANP